jgi:hypothetical protein
MRGRIIQLPHSLDDYEVAICGSTNCLVATFEPSEANNIMPVAKAGLMTENT